MTIIIVLRSRFFGSRLRSVGSDVVSVRLASRPQLLIRGTNVVHLFKIRIVCNNAVASNGACAVLTPHCAAYKRHGKVKSHLTAQIGVGRVQVQTLYRNIHSCYLQRNT